MMNPVWKREVQARWRGWRAFALLFSTAVILAVGFVWQYHYLTGFLDEEYSDPRQRLSLLGHELFALMAWLQVVLWMLIAPILTATAISNERAKGLLESLQLSRLSATQIVVGKLLSSLSLVALLILVTLPIVATCFLMGGVSPGEFLMVLALHVGTAIFCASLGLAISAWCRSSMAAIAFSLCAIAFWCAASFASVILAFNGLNGNKPPAPPWNALLEMTAKAHPGTAAIEVAGAISSSPIPWTTTTPSWIVSLIFLALASLFFLFIATLGTKRILLNPFRIEWKQLRRQLSVADTTNLETAKQSANAPAQTTQKKPKDKRWELGALARMQFANPILGREVRACFRPRSSSILMLILAVVLLPFALIAYAQGLYWVFFDKQMPKVIGPSLLGIYLMMTIVLCAVLGAGALAREHEGATWESLSLSLLTPREVLWGKMGAPLLICAVCGMVFLPIILPCVRSLVFLGSDRGRGISFTQLLGSLLLIGSSAFCFTSLGLLFSQWARRSTTAICWTLGVLFVLLLALPVYFSAVGNREMESFVNTWHPFLAFFNIFDRQNRYDAYNERLPMMGTLGMAFPSALLLLSIGVICTFILWRQLFKSRTGEAR